MSQNNGRESKNKEIDLLSEVSNALERKERQKRSLREKLALARVGSGANTGPLEIRDVDPYIDLSGVDDETREKIQQRLRLLSRGISFTGVLNCKGHKACPYRDGCPFIGLEPKGEKCPMEMASLDRMFDAYFQSLGIDGQDAAEITQLQSLLDLELKIMRANAQLSEDGMEQSTYKQGQDGSTFVEKKQHHLLKTLETLHNQKMKMLKSFKATRESRDVERDVFDLSNRINELHKAQGQKSRGQGSDK